MPTKKRPTVSTAPLRRQPKKPNAVYADDEEDEGKVLYGSLTKKRTAHVLGPPVRDVFRKDLEKNARLFLPLVSIDLGSVFPDLSGRAHFVYHEAHLGPLSFQQAGERIDYSGRDDFDRTNLDTVETLHGYLELSTIEREDWLIRLGGRPRWLSDSPPRTDDGQEMRFIGQLNPARFAETLDEADFYLFYSPEQKLFTLIDQIS